MDHQPTAELLARCSEVVYAKKGEGYAKWRGRLKDDLRELKIQLIWVIDENDVQGFVGLHYGHRITCIRGTDSKAEGLTNFIARRNRNRTVIPGIRMHSKFFSDAVLAMDLFGRHIDYADGKYVDWFTGHSRGGSVAAIMAVFYDHMKRHTKSGLPPTYLVTHAMPRAGNWAFSKYLAKHIKHVRWQRGGDIVPLLPLPPMFWHDCPSAFFDSESVFRGKASFLTRMIEWPSAVLKHFSASKVLGFHGMTGLRVLIAAEESELDGGNILTELLS